MFVTLAFSNEVETGCAFGRNSTILIWQCTFSKVKLAMYLVLNGICYDKISTYQCLRFADNLTFE